MEDTLKNNVLNICRIMEELKASDVVALNMDNVCSWTSVMIIGTVTSHVHMHGIREAIVKDLKDSGLEVLSGSRKSEDNTWIMIDAGSIVVSLMDREARDFYALEERWFEAEAILPENYSSSSS